MSTADLYIADMYTKTAKALATPFGVYTVQCTEGGAGDNTPEATRLASLAATFRLRQAPDSVKYRDLYATRRAAIVNAAGSHAREAYAIKYPAAAWAGVRGKAEAMRACSRYFGEEEDKAAEYMSQCVDWQHKGMKAVGGVYSTLCADGRRKGEAEVTRIASLATRYRAKTMGVKERMQMRYDASLQAVYLGHGCHHEEQQFVKFRKMASAMRYGDGSFAASVGTTADYMGGKLMTVEEQVKSENLFAYWPGYLIRPAIKRQKKPWESSLIKSYAYMSEAAVEYGKKANSKPFVPSEYAGWRPGWKPKSTLTGY